MTLAALVFFGAFWVPNGGDFNHWSLALRAVYGITVFLVTIGVFLGSAKLLARDLTLVLTTAAAAPTLGVVARARALYARPWVRRIVNVVWLLIVGAAGSQIAEWIYAGDARPGRRA